MTYKISAIYQIRNLLNNKIYIGSAVIFNKRKNTHLWCLRKNIHHSKHLQNSWNKNGENNFIFEILEIIEDKTKLIEREQFFFDLLKPEYNNSPTAGNNLGFKMTEEQKKWRSDNLRGPKAPMFGKKHTPEAKKRMSLSHSGNKNYNFGKPAWNKGITGKNCHVSKKIDQLDFNNNLIKTWNSMKDVQISLGFSRGNICECCKGNRKQANGYKWRYSI